MRPGEYLQRVRAQAPLVHCITNYVTVNDCANVLLACGASPIMADDIDEAAEITSLCSGLCINIGTLSRDTIPSMYASGKRANELDTPVFLDPVGAGASKLRTDVALGLLDEVRFAVIRGNASEIRALAGTSLTTRGVDAAPEDLVTESTLDATVALARALAKGRGSVVAITGATDIATDGIRTFLIRNGRPEMGRITGTGCQLSALTTAFVAASPDEPLEATVAAICTMGLCGEKAFARMASGDGNSSYRNRIIDDVCNLTPEMLEHGATYELR